jgi:hypothetical protein
MVVAILVIHSFSPVFLLAELLMRLSDRQSPQQAYLLVDIIWSILPARTGNMDGTKWRGS